MGLCRKVEKWFDGLNFGFSHLHDYLGLHDYPGLKSIQTVPVNVDEKTSSLLFEKKSVENNRYHTPLCYHAGVEKPHRSSTEVASTEQRSPLHQLSKVLDIWIRSCVSLLLYFELSSS